jgi:hypothetical protein
MPDFWDADPQLASSPAPPPPAAQDDFWEGTAPDPGKDVSGYVAAGGRSTWGDVVQGVKAGAYGVAADTAGAVAAVQEPGAAQSATQSFALSQGQAAREAEQGMTPASQAPGLLKHPMVSVAEALPSIVSIAGPAAAAGPFAPAVASGLMGAQTLGAAQNRAAEQNIELTPEQKLTQFGIGAVSGVVPELGIASKVVTSPIVRTALEGGIGAGSFGAAGAGGEAVSQQTEIGAGKRTGYDIPAIVGAGETGMEQGAGFSLLGSGRHRDAEPGVSASPTRSGKADARKPEAQVAGRTPGPLEAGARQPASPVADPTLAAGVKGEPIVTPGSNQQAEAVKQPTPVVQPMDVGAAEATGAPPAGEAPPPPSPPPAAVEPAPAPAPAAPEQVIPEPPSVIAAQHQALLDPNDPREAMVYNPKQQPIDITGNNRIGQTRLKDGRVVQYDKQGPSALTPQKIGAYARSNRLNELLQLSPVNKDEAVQTAASVAGEQPAVVATTTDTGAPVKEAAATTSSVPGAVAMQEATKGPGDTVGVKSPLDMVAERQGEVTPESKPLTIGEQLAARNAERAAQAQSFEAERVARMEALKRDMNQQLAAQGQAPGPADRVLRAEGDTEKAMQAAQAAAQDRVQGVTTATAEEPKPKGKNWTKGELAKKENANQAANEIMQAERNHPKPNEQPNDILARAKGIVAEAKGIHVPTEISEEGKHGPGMMLLREAKDLIAKDLPKQDKFPSMADYARFIDREGMIRRGEFAEALEARRAEGKESAALGAPAEVKAEGVRPGEGGEHLAERSAEEEVIHREEEEERAKTEPEEISGRWDVPEDASKGDIARKLEAAKAMARDQSIGAEERDAAMRGVQRLQEALQREPEGRARPQIEVKEGEHYTAPTAAVGFKVEKTRPKWKKEEAEESVFSRLTKAQQRAEEGEHPAKVTLTAHDGKEVTISPSRTTDAETAIKENHAEWRYAQGAPQIMSKLRDLIVKLAGDIKVHYVTDTEMRSITGGNSRGAFSYDDNVILLNTEHLDASTPIHEAFHGAIAVGLKRQPYLRDLMERLRVEVRKNLPDNLTKEDQRAIAYYLSDHEEFLNGMMTNPRMQELLKGVKVSKELAKDLGIPRWRKMTMWEGALSVIRQALGMGPRETSAIEAAMALSEEAMWQHPRAVGDLLEATGRAAQKDMRGWKLEAAPERDQEAFIRSPKETLSRVKDIDTNLMKQYSKDTIHNLGGSVMRGSAKLLSGTWLNDIHGHLFTDAKGKIIEAINDARNKVSHLHSQLMGDDRDTINRGYMLDKLYAAHMPNYARLLDLSQRYNIHADRDAPSIPKNPADAARRNWQRDKFGDEARALYRALPEELQKRYAAEKKHYMDKQAGMATAILDKILPMFDAPKGSTMDEVMERAHKNEMTDDDWNHYENLGIADRLHEAYRLANKKDVFFNSQRDGRYVVNGRYEMPKGGADHDYSGKELPDNQREFNTEADAHKYVTGTRMKATTREVNYHKDPTTGEIKQVSSQEAASIGTITPKYRVSLERQNFQAASSRAEAERNRQAMEADGVKELSGVMDKRDERAWSRINSADQQLLERKLDSRKDLNDAERQHMKDITRSMMLASRGGMSAHMIQARKVAGAKFDTAAGLHAYTRAINFHIARQSHITELDDAMDRLDAHEKAMRSAEPDDALRRSLVANELRDRVYGANANALSSTSSPLVHRLMTWAFVNFLARPSHILLSQIHPYIYSVPMLAARHGYWKSLQGQRQAMKDLGGMGHNLWEGVKSGVQVYKSGGEQNIDQAVAMAHGVDPILRMINGLKDKDERDAMQKMWETEHLHSAFDASVFSGSGLDRTNAVVRQFTDAMEANNRLSTALNAYRLERDMHKDKANALAYSRRVIEQTHGVFSPTNAATVFKNPIMRAVMQFRQQPMNLAIMMYRNIAKALPEKLGGAGDNEARWTLAYQLGTAAALGGMGGMPMDLPKLAGLGVQAVGGPSPADWDDKFYRALVDNLGETGAKLIHDGLPGAMGPFGPSLGHRTGFDAGLLFGEPKSDNVDDLFGYAAKSFAGASVGMGMDWLNALHQAEQGNFERAGEGILPGSLKDFMKTYRNATEGQTAGKQQVEPPSFGHELLQMLGFSSVESERMMAGHFALQKALKAQQAEQAQTKGAQLKAKQAARQSVLGVPVTAKERALGQEYQRAYQ